MLGLVRSFETELNTLRRGQGLFDCLGEVSTNAVVIDAHLLHVLGLKQITTIKNIGLLQRFFDAFEIRSPELIPFGDYYERIG